MGPSWGPGPGSTSPPSPALAPTPSVPGPDPPRSGAPTRSWKGKIPASLPTKVPLEFI